MDREAIIKRNNVNISGRGTKVMMFAHGFGSDQAVWRDVAAAFEDDYQLVLFDYVGSGKSDRSVYHSDRYVTLHGYAADVLDILRACQLRNVIFVGHSVSAMIGLLAANEAPERFDRLIMLAPTSPEASEPSREDMRMFTKPSLILQCGHDTGTTTFCTDLHYALKGSKLLQFPDCGPGPHVTRPAETIAVMKEYLARGAG